MTENTLVPTNHQMEVFQFMAKQAVGSKMYRGLGDEFAVMSVMLAARELNIPPMAALNGGIRMIQGMIEISPRMMNAMIRKKGHILRKISSSETECTLQGIRVDGEEDTETFTIEDARIAGLIKDGGAWKKWPKDMLYARCLSRLARRHFADVILTGYVEGEISETNSRPVVDNEIQISEVEVRTDEPELSSGKRSLIEETFFNQFGTYEKECWHDYISQLEDKFGLTKHQIITKYNANPELANEKMQRWLAMRGTANGKSSKIANGDFGIVDGVNV